MHAQSSSTAVILSLKYISRYVASCKTVNLGNEYQLFVISLILAHKCLDDNTYSNKTWSEITKIPVAEINNLEMAFMKCINFKIYVSRIEYFHWLKCLIEYIKAEQQQNVRQNINHNVRQNFQQNIQQNVQSNH